MRKKYHIEGIDCANCAAKVEKKMNELPDVEVTLTFATSQLMVDAENPDEVLPELRKIADKMEPGHGDRGNLKDNKTWRKEEISPP